MRWLGHVALSGMEGWICGWGVRGGAYRVLVGKPEGKKPL